MSENQVQVAFSEVLGGIMRHHRNKRAQKALADAAGMSVSTWSRVETGQASLTVEQLRLAARELGMKAWVVVKEAEELCDTTAAEASGFEVLDQRPPQRRAADMLVGGAVGFLVGKFFANRGRGGG